MAQRCKHTQMDRDATPSKAPKVGFQPRLSTFLGGSHHVWFNGSAVGTSPGSVTTILLGSWMVTSGKMDKWLNLIIHFKQFGIHWLGYSKASKAVFLVTELGLWQKTRFSLRTLLTSPALPVMTSSIGRAHTVLTLRTSATGTARVQDVIQGSRVPSGIASYGPKFGPSWAILQVIQFGFGLWLRQFWVPNSLRSESLGELANGSNGFAVESGGNDEEEEDDEE